jgi:endonuclease YncB( thermonuclease family)
MKEIIGVVESVVDGDSIVVRDKAASHRTSYRVRLEGVDAPELAQQYGPQSRQALQDIVLGKDVRVAVIGKDKYGRYLGTVFLDEWNINQVQIFDGWAWWFRKYAPDNKDYALAEWQARQAGVGLWEEPIPPWEWRKRTKKGEIVAYWLNTATGQRHKQKCRWFRNTVEGRICGPETGEPASCCKEE